MQKKRMITGFILFLGFMWLCTVISKSVYAQKLPMVTTISPEKKYIEHIVREYVCDDCGGGRLRPCGTAGRNIRYHFIHSAEYLAGCFPAVQ